MIETDLRLATAMLQEVESFFDTGLGLAIARRISGDVGFDLDDELARADDLLNQH